MTWPGQRFNQGRLARLLARVPVSSRYFGPPRGYAPTFASLTLPEGETVAELKPARVAHHRPPPLPDHPRLTGEAQAEYGAWPAPAQQLFRLPQARILGSGYGHGIITNADRFVLQEYETWSQPITRHPIHYALKLPPCSYLPGKTFSLAAEWTDNYWHWLFDVVGKLLLLREHPSNPTIDQLIALDLDRYPFKLQSLIPLGYQPEQMINLRAQSHVRCEELFVANRAFPNLLPEHDVVDALRRAYLPLEIRPDQPKRFYISRKNAPTRRIANEPELLEGLQRLGFVAVSLENMDFVEQLRLFHGATAILAQHGAGLANMIACQPGTHIMELFEPEANVSPCYLLLAEKLSLDYTFLCDGEPGHVTWEFWHNKPVESVIQVSSILKTIAAALH